MLAMSRVFTHLLLALESFDKTNRLGISVVTGKLQFSQMRRVHKSPCTPLMMKVIMRQLVEIAELL